MANDEQRTPTGKGSELQRAERQEQAWGMRVGGATYRQIAKQLGVSVSTAHDYIAAAMEERKERIGELADAERALQAERLDALILQHYPNRNDPRSAEIILKCLDRKARLYGLDAPKVVEHSGTVDVVHESTEQRRQRILEAAADRVASMTTDELTSAAARLLGTR